MTTAISGWVPLKGSITVTCVSAMDDAGAAPWNETVAFLVGQAEKKQRASNVAGIRRVNQSLADDYAFSMRRF
jgi:hypothetical protein